MDKVNIICMKWGNAYSADYVNKLYFMVARNLSYQFRFICFTDYDKGLDSNIEVQPLPEIDVPSQYQQSPWRKLSMFKPGLANLSGMTLFLDLDLIIIDNIDEFFTYGKPDDFCIIENWSRLGSGIGNSSVYRFNPNKYNFIYEAYSKNPTKACMSCDNEQIFLSRQIQNRSGNLIFWPAHWCRSFKRHALRKWPFSWFFEPVIPKYAKIIVFHGNPKPDDAARGKWPGRFWKRFCPASWINEYWR